VVKGPVHRALVDTSNGTHPKSTRARNFFKEFFKYADMVVLSADPRTVPPEKIAELEVRATFLAERQNYGFTARTSEVTTFTSVATATRDLTCEPKTRYHT
jgi:hypothetical protein